MFKFVQENKIKDIREKDTFNRSFYVGKFIEDKEHTVDDYIQANSEYVLTSSAEAVEQKKADIRAVRNGYLTETDKYMIADFPITEEERERYRAYRQYLRDYPETEEGWYEQNPKTFEEWGVK